MTLKLGYIRVSTDAKEDGREQTLDQQKEILMTWGVQEEHIFQDRISGSKNITEGAGWERLEDFIENHPEKQELELCAVKFDRISRDFLQLQNTIASLNAKGIGITAEGYQRFIAKDTMDLMRIAMESFGAALYRERVRKATSEKLQYLKNVKGVQLGPPAS